MDPRIDERVKEYLFYPANELKRELKSHGLLTKGRKPDLARRLAEYEYLDENPEEGFSMTRDEKDKASSDPSELQKPTTYLDAKGKKSKKKQDDDAAETYADNSSSSSNSIMKTFAGLRLSETAGRALGKAQFDTPTPIQRKGLPGLFKGESAVLHAETGSGKTLAYLLPITEAMWKDELLNNNSAEESQKQNQFAEEDTDLRYGLILTPTRELAAQVAGVASVLAPPGSVRLVSRPTDLMSEGRYWKERRGDRVDDPEFLGEEDTHRGRGSPPRLFVGSAKAIMGSLYGDGKMPASPTRKPAAKELLSQTRWIVLDEVDRLLHVKTKKGLSSSQRSQRANRGYDFSEGGGGSRKGGGGKTGPLHEKPAAVLTSAVARRTLGRAQVIAASATVGRTLKRELSRVLGLPPKEYPRVIRGDNWDADDANIDEDGYDIDDGAEHMAGQGHVDRAVTIPESVTNYVLPIDTDSSGKLLTNAFFAVKNLNNSGKGKQKILLVLTKGCGITTSNAIGALKHFKCEPEPQSLLDVLQNADGADQLMDVHRQVSGSDGIGESTYFGGDEDAAEDDDDNSEGYLLVTGEDTVRGMHLAGLDTVVVVGRPSGPDEYIHIAGRTGRAGRRGKVINVLSEQHAAAMTGWEKMLNVEFQQLNMKDIESLE